MKRQLSCKVIAKLSSQPSSRCNTMASSLAVFWRLGGSFAIALYGLAYLGIFVMMLGSSWAAESTVFLVGTHQYELLHSENMLTEKTCTTKPLAEGVTADYSSGKGHFVIQGGNRGVRHRIPLPEWKKGDGVYLSFRLRTVDAVVGDLEWKNARVDVFFRDAKNKMLKHNNPRAFRGIGTTDWQKCERVYNPPEGTKFIEVYPVNYGPSGMLEVDSFVVQLVRERLDMDSPDGRGVAEVFSLDDAWRRETATRKQISLNGLWQFHLLKDDEPREVPPAIGTGWGWQKVPGSWRSESRYGTPQQNPTPAHIAKSIQTAIPLPHFAWYRRRITVPKDWDGFRILLQLDGVNASAKVHVDGKVVGTIQFACGELDLTKVAKPGREILVEILVEALPMEQQRAMGGTRIYKDMGELANKGLCGEARLEAVPFGPRISDVHVRTYVGRKRIEFNTGFLGLPKGDFQLSAIVRGPDNFVKTFPPQKITSDGAAESRHSAVYDWIAPKLWDIDCPENLYTAEISLLDAAGKVLDVLYPEEFGFREFTIDGRNFLLNGTIIHLRSIANQAGANSAYSHEEAVKELVKRCRAIHVNFLIDGDKTYSFMPGKFAYQDAYRQVTSRMGLLTSLTMPNFSFLPDLAQNPESQKRFRKLAEQRLRRYQNLPGLVMQSTSHNLCPYPDMQNPTRIGNGYTPEK